MTNQSLAQESAGRFEITASPRDVLRCECGARRRVVGWVLERGVAVRILRHLGLAWEAPVMEPSRACLLYTSDAADE